MPLLCLSPLNISETNPKPDLVLDKGDDLKHMLEGTRRPQHQHLKKVPARRLIQHQEKPVREL